MPTDENEQKNKTEHGKRQPNHINLVCIVLPHSHTKNYENIVWKCAPFSLSNLIFFVFFFLETKQYTN